MTRARRSRFHHERSIPRARQHERQRARRQARRERSCTESVINYSVQHSTDALCRRWAQVSDDSRRTGRPITAQDAWIAVTVLQLGVPFVTHYRADFAGVAGLKIISES